MGDLAEQIRVMMKAAIESAPRTIIPDTSAPQVPQNTKPAQKVKDDTQKEAKPKAKEVKPAKVVSEELQDMQDRAIYQFNGVDLEVYKYFDKSPSTASKEEIDKLRYLSEKMIGDGLKSGLKKIQDIEIKIGRTDENERLIRVYNNVRIRNLR